MLSPQEQIELLKLRIENIERHLSLTVAGFAGTLLLEDPIDESATITDKSAAKAEQAKEHNKYK